MHETKKNQKVYKVTNIRGHEGFHSDACELKRFVVNLS